MFEIRNYDEDIRSYRKLIPALKDFPNEIIQNESQWQARIQFLSKCWYQNNKTLC